MDAGPKKRVPDKGAGETIRKGRVAPLPSRGRAPIGLIQSATYPHCQKEAEESTAQALARQPTDPWCRPWQHPEAVLVTPPQESA